MMRMTTNGYMLQMLYEYDDYGRTTAIPLSSGVRGITIESEPATGNFTLVRYNVVVEKLTIGPELYDFLKVGIMISV